VGVTRREDGTGEAGQDPSRRGGRQGVLHRLLLVLFICVVSACVCVCVCKCRRAGMSIGWAIKRMTDA